MPNEILETISKLPLPATLISNHISELQKGKWQLFTLLTQSFVPFFPGIQSNVITTLTLATYLGARAVYTLDPVIDAQANKDEIIPALRENQFLFTEATRQLCSIFNNENEFWQTYYNRLNAHFEEPVLSKQTNQQLNLANYSALLQKKYSLLFIPSDAMYFLTNKIYEQNYKQLQQLLQVFILGYNIPNEVKGLSTDMECRINNYAYWRLKNHLPQYNLHTNDFSPEDLHKLLYASGLASILYEEALQALTQANNMAQEANLFLLQKLITARIAETTEELNLVAAELNA